MKLTIAVGRHKELFFIKIKKVLFAIAECLFLLYIPLKF